MTTRARLGRFWGVGLLGFVVQSATLAGLADLLLLPLPMATAAAVGAALVHNFLWHRRWTWADRREGTHALAAFGRFVAANGLVSLAGNVFLVTVLAGGLGIATLTANAVAVAACSLVNFALGEAVVFRAALKSS